MQSGIGRLQVHENSRFWVGLMSANHLRPAWLTGRSERFPSLYFVVPEKNSLYVIEYREIVEAQQGRTSPELKEEGRTAESTDAVYNWHGRYS